MKDIHDLDFDDLICVARKQAAAWQRIEGLAQAGRTAELQNVDIRVRDQIQGYARTLAMDDAARQELCRQVIEDRRWVCRKTKKEAT